MKTHKLIAVVIAFLTGLVTTASIAQPPCSSTNTAFLMNVTFSYPANSDSVVTPATALNSQAGPSFVTISVVAGKTYGFVTANSAPGLNTAITLFNDANNATLASNDNGGMTRALSSDYGAATTVSNDALLVWTASLTGVIKVLVTTNTCGAITSPVGTNLYMYYKKVQSDVSIAAITASDLPTNFASLIPVQQSQQNYFFKIGPAVTNVGGGVEGKNLAQNKVLKSIVVNSVTKYTATNSNPIAFPYGATDNVGGVYFDPAYSPAIVAFNPPLNTKGAYNVQYRVDLVGETDYKLSNNSTSYAFTITDTVFSEVPVGVPTDGTTMSIVGATFGNKITASGLKLIATDTLTSIAFFIDPTTFVAPKYINTFTISDGTTTYTYSGSPIALATYVNQIRLCPSDFGFSSPSAGFFAKGLSLAAGGNLTMSVTGVSGIGAANVSTTANVFGVANVPLFNFDFGPANHNGINTPIVKGCSGDSIHLLAPAGTGYKWYSSVNGAGYNLIAGATNAKYDDALLSSIGAAPYKTTYKFVVVYTLPGGCMSDSAQSLTITIGDKPAADIGNNANPTICELNTFTPGGFLNNNTVAVSKYRWTRLSGGISNITNDTLHAATFAPTSSATFVLTETIRATGCTNANNLIVTVNPAPMADAGVDQIICQDTSTTIGTDTINGNSYSWTVLSGGDAGSLAANQSAKAKPTVNPTITSSYALVQTIIATGCTKKDTVKVTVRPSLVAGGISYSGPNTLCENTSGILTLSGAPTGAVYNWTATDLADYQTATNDSIVQIRPIYTTAGSSNYNKTYTVVVSDNGCSESTSIAILVGRAPAALTGPNQSICTSGGSVTLGAAPYVSGTKYSWTPVSTLSNAGSNQPTASPVSTTTYSLTQSNDLSVTPLNGCQRTNAVVVKVAPAATTLAASKTNICSGESTTINANSDASTTFSWTSSPTGFTSTSSAVIVSPTITTTYTVVATNGACTDTKSITINVSSLATPVISPAGNVTACSGSTVALTATVAGATSYQWFLNGIQIPGATFNGYNATNNGSYTVEASNGICTTPASAATVLTFINNSTKPAVTGANSFCAGGSSALTTPPVSGATYQWSNNGVAIPGATSNVYSAVTAGTYTVVVSISGCPSPVSDAIVVTVTPFPATPTITQSGNVLTAATSTSGVTYQWYKNAVAVPTGGTSVSYTLTSAAANGTYTVVVNLNGCTATSAPLVAAWSGISTVAAPAAISIYPNPATDKLTVEFTGAENATVAILDITGQIVKQQVATSGTSINVADLARGVYTIKVVNGANTAVKRIVLY